MKTFSVGAGQNIEIKVESTRIIGKTPALNAELSVKGNFGHMHKILIKTTYNDTKIL